MTARAPTPAAGGAGPMAIEPAVRAASAAALAPTLVDEALLAQLDDLLGHGLAWLETSAAVSLERGRRPADVVGWNADGVATIAMGIVGRDRAVPTAWLAEDGLEPAQWQWRGDHLWGLGDAFARLPDTLREALIGRTVGEMIDHAPLADRRILGLLGGDDPHGVVFERRLTAIADRRPAARDEEEAP